MNDYTIRPFETIEDHEQCVDVQTRVWAGDAAVPTNLTIAMARHGGVAIGAFDAENRMFGFVFSFVAPCHYAGAHRGLCHHSHMAALLPAWQNRGIGEELKRAQARAVLADGYNLMTWTYDPIEARNARLNIGKLGAICRTYIRNCYGEMKDVLNAGLPSDRFEVEWWLDKQHDGDVVHMAGGHLTLNPRSQPSVTVDIPRDFQAVKRHDYEAARRWRFDVREQFERAFEAGYAVTGFNVTSDRAFYELVRTRG